MAFVIKEHHPGRLAVRTILLLLLWATCVWSAYHYGWNEAAHLFDHEFQKSKPLYDRLKDVVGKNRDLQARMAIFERTAQVNREAKAGLVQEIRDLQQQAAELREEISFYKLIISPENSSKGLGVYSLRVTPAAENLYHFKMILTQAGESDTLAEGDVDMTIKGVLNGQAEHLRLSDIQVPEDKALTYRFQYFQELTGSLQLPEEFVPREVVVELTQNGDDEIENPVKRFDWLNVRT